MRNQGGVTILEILLVIAIFVIIFGISASGYVTWRQHVILINSREELKSTLLKAQQLATAAAENDNWGVHLENKAYTLFKGSFYNEEDPLNITKDLTGVEIFNASTTVADGAGGLGSEIVFTKFSGQTANTGTIQLIYSIDSGVSQLIQVLSSGRID